jgi:hypothetical protein
VSSAIQGVGQPLSYYAGELRRRGSRPKFLTLSDKQWHAPFLAPLADLDRSWQQQGRELLDRVRTERPKVYFRALVKAYGDSAPRARRPSNNFDRRRHRQEVLQRAGAVPPALIPLERRAIRRYHMGRLADQRG